MPKDRLTLLFFAFVATSLVLPWCSLRAFEDRSTLRASYKRNGHKPSREPLAAFAHGQISFDCGGLPEWNNRGSGAPVGDGPRLLG